MSILIQKFAHGKLYNMHVTMKPQNEHNISDM
jgi:hypothetical protein